MFDRLSKPLKEKLSSFDESGMGYWIVTAKLKDGSEYMNVCITDNFKFGFPGDIPFKLGDIVDIKWEGYRGGQSSGQVIKLR